MYSAHRAKSFCCRCLSHFSFPCGIFWAQAAAEFNADTCSLYRKVHPKQFYCKCSKTPCEMGKRTGHWHTAIYLVSNPQTTLLLHPRMPTLCRAGLASPLFGATYIMVECLILIFNCYKYKCQREEHVVLLHKTKHSYTYTHRRLHVVNSQTWPRAGGQNVPQSSTAALPPISMTTAGWISWISAKKLIRKGGICHTQVGTYLSKYYYCSEILLKGCNYMHYNKLS